MEHTNDKNWFGEHFEGMLIWGISIFSIAITMYIVVHH